MDSVGGYVHAGQGAGQVCRLVALMGSALWQEGYNVYVLMRKLAEVDKSLLSQITADKLPTKESDAYAPAYAYFVKRFGRIEIFVESIGLMRVYFPVPLMCQASTLRNNPTPSCRSLLPTHDPSLSLPLPPI